MSQSLNAFLMDEQLEPLDSDDRATKLDILKPHRDGDDIELRDDVELAAPLTDSEVVALEAALIDLEDLRLHIQQNGMSQAVALEMQKMSEKTEGVQQFLNETNKINMYTTEPTKVGVDTGLESLIMIGRGIAANLADKVMELWKAICAALARLRERAKDLWDRYGYVFSRGLRDLDAGQRELINAVATHFKEAGEADKAAWLSANVGEYITHVLQKQTFIELSNSESSRAVASNFKDLADNSIRRARLIASDRDTVGSLDKLISLHDKCEQFMMRDVVSDSPIKVLRFMASNVAGYKYDRREVEDCIDKLQVRFNKGNAETTNIAGVPDYRRSVKYLNITFATIKDLQSVNSMYLKVTAFITTHLQMHGEIPSSTPAFKNLVRFVNQNMTVAH